MLTTVRHNVSYCEVLMCLSHCVQYGTYITLMFKICSNTRSLLYLARKWAAAGEIFSAEALEKQTKTRMWQTWKQKHGEQCPADDKTLLSLYHNSGCLYNIEKYCTILIALWITKEQKVSGNEYAATAHNYAKKINAVHGTRMIYHLVIFIYALERINV